MFVAVSKGHRNAVWSLFSNVTYALSQWILLVVLARLSDPYTLGVFSLALSVAAPVFMAANMRLRFVQFADVVDRWGFRDFLGVRVCAATVAVIVCGVIAMLWRESGYAAAVLLAVASFKAMEALQDICIGAYQKRSRMHLAAISSASSGVLVVLTFWLLFRITESLVWASLGVAVARLLALVSIDLPAASRVMAVPAPALSGTGSSGDSGGGWRSLILRAWPLGIVAALDSLNSGVPRYFLAWNAGNTDLGIYVAMAHVSFAGFVVVNAIGQSMSPMLAGSFGCGDMARFRRLGAGLVGAATIVGLLGVVGALLVGDSVVRLLYGGAFDVSVVDFALVMGAGGFSYVSLAAIFALSAAQRLGIQVWLYVANFLAVVLGSLVLIPALGISGAALALLVAHGMQVVLSFVFLEKALRKA